MVVDHLSLTTHACVSNKNRPHRSGPEPSWVTASHRIGETEFDSAACCYYGEVLSRHEPDFSIQDLFLGAYLRVLI